MAKVDNLPRGAYRYNSVDESNRATPNHYPHFKIAPRIDVVPPDVTSPENTAMSQSIYENAVIGNRMIEATINLGLRGPRIALTSFLDEKEPITGLLKGEVLALAADDLDDEVLGIREATSSFLVNPAEADRFLAGGIFGIRTHREKAGKVMAVEGESIGIVIDTNHHVIHEANLPNEIVVEILEAVIAAEISVQQARSDGSLDKFLTVEDINTAYDWLLGDIYLPIAS